MRSIYEGFLRVGRSPLPTVAAVNGAAVGAGMNLALCCDVRIAGRRAKFDTRFLQLGLHPGGGHTWMMRRALGPQGAAAMVLFGDVLDGAAAERVGLAWRCVDDDELLPAACSLAAGAASAPPALARRLKATLGLMADVGSHENAVDVELDAQLWSMAQPEFAARLAAMRSAIRSK
jgi:enoyl-CoA hydratase